MSTLVLILVGCATQAQSVDQRFLDVLKVNQKADLPKDLLSTRSIVLISVPANGPSGAWKEWAVTLQTFFGEAGIDAVAYLSVEELAENTVAQKELTSKVFSKRGISHLITLSVLDNDGHVLMTVGPYNRKWTFLDDKASLWMRETTDIKSIWSELEDLFKTGAFPRKNLLVLDTPEFFDLNISFSSRTERFTRVMESQKVAVPMYVALEDDPNRVLRFKSDILTGNEDRSAQATEVRNSQLKLAVDRYPFEAEMVNLNEKSETEWLRSGYGFIMYHATDSEKKLRSKLKYKADPSYTNNRLTKYYLKQLRTGNLYFGREWDAGSTRLEALQNFINRVRTEFKSDN